MAEQDQLLRLSVLHSLAHPGQNPSDFIKPRIGRSASSLEEELVSNLEIFEEAEEKQFTTEAVKVLDGSGLAFPNPQAFDYVLAKNPELGKKIKSMGLVNFQKMLQVDFYKKAEGILNLSKAYEFRTAYHAVTPVKFGTHTAACFEDFIYEPTAGYASMLYHLMRHLTNVTGEETKQEVERRARQTFGGKKVLELGCGPGFFLYALRELGADVTGLDLNDKDKDRIKAAKLNIQFGNAKDLAKIVGNQQYDVIFSKDFLSFAVTRDDSFPIMEQVYASLKDGGLTLHQINYKRSSEQKYFEQVAKLCDEKKLDFERFKREFTSLGTEEKEMLLRRNIFNIGPASLDKIGFKPLTSYVFDVQQYLSIALTKNPNYGRREQ